MEELETDLDNLDVLMSERKFEEAVDAIQRLQLQAGDKKSLISPQVSSTPHTHFPPARAILRLHLPTTAARTLARVLRTAGDVYIVNGVKYTRSGAIVPKSECCGHPCMGPAA